MKSMCEALRQGRTLVSDGAWGTFLIAKGMEMSECPELWNVDHADDVREIAATYKQAGADIVMTNSFGGTRIKLAPYGLQDRAAELNEAAARISREAMGDDGFVMASMGPTGKLLMMGEVSEDELYEVFKEQAQALERGGADAIIVETMMAVDEACIAVRAAKENTQLEVVASFTFGTKTADGYRTMMGSSPADAAQAALEAGADILGTNCSLGSDEMLDVVKALRAAAPDAPILAHPNAGQPVQQDDGSIVYPESPETMGENAKAMAAAGAGIVGGCCGTGPDHIAALRAALA